jgi:hypothetical protein
MAKTKTKNFVLRTHVMLNHFLGKNKIEKNWKVEGYKCVLFF